MEHGEPPIGYFDINCLYKIFNYLTDNGYHVIYKRPTNTEFVRDSNEHLDMNIYSYVDGEGVVTDFDLYWIIFIYFNWF